MPEFPIQLTKVQPPPLREQTLARDRLLDWLAAKIHDRVVLVIAEAGYGKTTLLADFSRRTRLRTLWYRLDRGDRDWIGFVAHLVAAVRTQLPEFGQATAAVLRETATAMPSVEAVVDTFVRELGQLPADATALILDDFHLVDDSAEIRQITKELLARAPERLTFVFASRRVPPVPLARLRALGEVAELRTDDLRFDEAETERLFNETYDMPLERGLITELSKRTEGWAASLQLVRAALHDRDPVQARAFIGSLSGAEGHLYDYLAEEVIGDLPPALQDFLMRTSILETIDLELAAVAAGVTRAEAREYIADAERLGLVSRRGLHGRHQVRAHPLVREFLQARLARVMTSIDFTALHHAVATAAAGIDWRIAAYHFLASGDAVAAQRIIRSSLDRILATGAYASAQALASGAEEASTDPATYILASRVAMLRADSVQGLALAERALLVDPTSPAAVLTLMTARSLAGDVAGAVAAGAALETSPDALFGQLARAMRTGLETSVSGSFGVAMTEMDALLSNLDAGHAHFRGTAELFKSMMLIAVGDPVSALASAERAIADLQASSAGIELTSALLGRAIALAFLGRLIEARAAAEAAHRTAPEKQHLEVAFESAWLEVAFGDDLEAERRLQTVAEELTPETDNGAQALLVLAELGIRRGDGASATRLLNQIPPNVLRTTVGFEARRLIAAARTMFLQGDLRAAKAGASHAKAHALSQRADAWVTVAALLEASLDGRNSLNQAIQSLASERQWAISLGAEFIAERLSEFDETSFSAIATEAKLRPERWRPTLRRIFDDHPSDDVGFAAARLLSDIGTSEDVARLQRSGGRGRRRDGYAFGRALARRLAATVMVEDLGRLRIRVGDRTVEGTETRRKVLALLCLLVSREGFSMTRDEVLDSLWPDLDPEAALNSLNQTVYFLRRVFEPGFREDESPGYVHHDGETIWLDTELVDSRSRECRELINRLTREPDQAGVLALTEKYTGRFALDFSYEEWATSYREALHASFLRVVEQAVRQDTNEGAFNRAIEIAERVAVIEPDSDEIQIALVRLYRLAGAYAAAAEQYGRYASNVRGIGVDPLPFDVVVGGSGSIGTPAY